MKNLIILIPPSEGKAPGGNLPPLKKVSPPVRHVIDQFAGLSTSQWSKTLGLKAKALEAAIAANTSILKSPTLPAIERYTGVVYSAIDFPTLRAKAKTFFNNHVRIVSGVFGLVHPQDPIPDYKLAINKLKADAHWRPFNAKALSGAYVLDLLPKAHKKAVAYTQGREIDFVVEKNGKKMPAGHQGKHIKGRFIRYLCEQGKCDEAVLKGFCEDGFKWRGDKFLKVSDQSQESSLGDNREMDQIRSDENLMKKLKRGHIEAKDIKGKKR